MLGLLRGIEQGVVREGAAQRSHYGTVLQSKDNHLGRLLDQIRYNQQQKRLRERDARQDFVSDRAYDRGVLESDRTHAYRVDRAETADAQFDAVQALRENADRRAGVEHDFNYGDDGMMHLRKNIFENELAEYDANAPIRDLQRQYNKKLLGYNIGEGWDETLEERSLAQDLTRAQINAYNRPRSTTSGRSGPTWTQTRDITIENLAPSVLKYLKGAGEHAVMPWHKDAQFWPPGFQADRPWVSENKNEITQTKLLRQAGGHLIEELIARGVDPQTALTMVPDYWDQILDTKGSDVLKRLKRSSGGQYDDLKFRKVLRDIVHQGAMNFMQFGHYDRPQGAGTSDADKVLDSIRVD